MGAGASATAGPSAWSPAKAQVAPATAALSDLSTKSGTPVAELLGMTVSELTALVEDLGIRPAAMASRAAEMGIEQAMLDAAVKAGSNALLSLIQQAAYQEAGRKSAGAVPASVVFFSQRWLTPHMDPAQAHPSLLACSI